MDERAGILNSNKAARSDAASVPSAVAWLGGLGIVPFAGLSLATPFASDVLRTQLSFALLHMAQ
jgi:predicted component of type VI protein secretion system